MDKTKNEQAVEKAKNNLPSIDSAWGAGEMDGQRDMLIPKIYHQQALSQFVAAGKAAAGDFCDSITGDLLCEKKEALEVIIFDSFNNRLISKWNTETKKFEWVETETITPDNSDKPFEETIDGELYRNQTQYNYFCLLANKPEEMPYVFSLSSTKTATARKLNTIFARLKEKNLPSARHVIKFVSKYQEDGPQKKWFNLDIEGGRLTTEDELKRAYNWFKKMKVTKFTVAEAQGGDTSEDGPGFEGYADAAEAEAANAEPHI